MSNAVRALRQALGITQAALAAKLETTVTSIARYETNQRIPRGRTLARLAKLAIGTGNSELAALFQQALSIELRDVMRKGYSAVLTAPQRTALGIREMSTADLTRAKDLLADMWSATTSATSSQLRQSVRRCVIELAQLMLEDGVDAFNSAGTGGSRPRPGRRKNAEGPGASD